MNLTETEIKKEFLAGENISINLKGLALMHRGESFWRTWFPTIEHHDLALKIGWKEGVAPKTFLIPSGSTIEISFEIEAQKEDDGTFFQKILNVNDEYLHRGGLKVRSDNDNEITKMKFSRNVNFSSFGKSRNFEIWRCDSSGDYKQKITEQSSMDQAIAVFRCKEGSTTRIIIRGPIDAEFALPHHENSHYEIEFDNDCHSLGCATSSDYHFYYTLIDLPEGQDKFELIPKSTIPTKAPEPMCDMVYGDRLEYKPW